MEIYCCGTTAIWSAHPFVSVNFNASPWSQLRVHGRRCIPDTIADLGIMRESLQASKEMSHGFMRQQGDWGSQIPDSIHEFDQFVVTSMNQAISQRTKT